MITLYGFQNSNYHNIVKHVLLYKDLQFEEKTTYPASPEIKKLNPVAKVPVLVTENGTSLSETSVIIDYLEEAYPQAPLYPSDPEERAKVRRLIKVSELYLELAARKLLPAQFGAPRLDDQSLAKVRAELELGAKAISVLAEFSPYLCGNKLTMADIFLRYALAIPMIVGPSQLDWNILESISGLEEWDNLMKQSDISLKVDSDQKANIKDFNAYIAEMSRVKHR